jgi:hypothetical protein
VARRHGRRNYLRHREPAEDVYVETMNALRHARFRRLAMAGAILLPVAAWATSLGGGFIVGAGPRGEG